MKKFGFAIIATIIISSCSTLKITNNQDKEVDISKSKTFSYNGWTEVNDMVEVDRVVIEKAFAKELKQRGLTYKESGGDIIVSLFIVVNKGTTTNRYNSYYGHGPYGFYQPTWGWGMGYSGGYGSSSGVPYKESAFYKGTLVCDVFDNKTKKLAWQGVVSKALDKTGKKRGDIDRIAARVMKSFPIEKLEE